MDAMQIYSYVAYTAIALGLVWFLLVAWRALWMLLYHRVPRWKRLAAWGVSGGVLCVVGTMALGWSVWGRGAGPLTVGGVIEVSLYAVVAAIAGLVVTLTVLGSPGIARAWAVGRTAFAEGWAAKAWAVPVVWLGVCLILNAFVQPHADDQRERIGLYLNTLIRAQELMLLVLMGVLACLSLPRERERRTVITTGAKPISRLELLLGKVLGLSVLAGLLIALMGLTAWGYAVYADRRGQARSRELYARWSMDYEKSKGQAVSPPPEGLKLAGERGVLEAANYITAHGGMQVAGRIDYTQTPPLRRLKGGSQERLILVFDPIDLAPAGLPWFYFVFQGEPPEVAESMATPSLPPQVELQVTVRAQRYSSLAGIKEERVILVPHPNYAGVYLQNWRPASLDGICGEGGAGSCGPVVMEIKCTTPGVFLVVRDLREAGDTNVFVNGSAAAGSSGSQTPRTAPKMLGFEKRNNQQIEGPPISRGTPEQVEAWLTRLREMMAAGPDRDQVTTFIKFQEVASWRFRAKDLDRAPIPIDPATNTFKISLYLELEKTSRATQSLPTTAAITAYNQDTKPEDRQPLLVTVPEKKVLEVRLPAQLLHRSATGAINSDLFVDLHCVTPGHWVEANDDGVRLELPSSPFAVNLAKSEAVIFMEAVVLIAVGVVASVRLGWPVAMLVTVWVYLMAWFFDFIQETAKSGGDSLLTFSGQQQLSGNWVYKLFLILHGASLKVSYFLVLLMPDFRRYDPLTRLLAFRDMPWQSLGIAAAWTAACVLPVLAIGYLMIRKQELA